MKIATWNVNGIRARLELILLWLQDRKPDLIGLQEIKIVDNEFPHEEFERIGYQAITHGQKSWNGVAILSREPIDLVQQGLPGEEENGSRFLSVRQNDLLFATAYCPNGKDLKHPDYRRKLTWFKSLISHWETNNSSGQPAIICGDFNIVPQPYDSWRGEAGDGTMFHSLEERTVMKELIDLGLIDLYRLHNSNDPNFSWWDYRGGSFHRNHGLRIDFILGNKDIANLCTNAIIDRDYRKKKGELTASDHAPVIAELSTTD